MSDVVLWPMNNYLKKKITTIKNKSIFFLPMLLSLDKISWHCSKNSWRSFKIQHQINNDEIWWIVFFLIFIKLWKLKSQKFKNWKQLILSFYLHKTWEIFSFKVSLPCRSSFFWSPIIVIWYTFSGSCEKRIWCFTYLFKNMVYLFFECLFNICSWDLPYAAILI